MDTVKDDLGVHITYTAAGEHESVAKSNNNMVKDCARSIFFYLLFKMIPNIMVIKITNISNQLIN